MKNKSVTGIDLTRETKTIRWGGEDVAIPRLTENEFAALLALDGWELDVVRREKKITNPIQHATTTAQNQHNATHYNTKGVTTWRYTATNNNLKQKPALYVVGGNAAYGSGLDTRQKTLDALILLYCINK